MQNPAPTTRIGKPLGKRSAARSVALFAVLSSAVTALFPTAASAGVLVPGSGRSPISETVNLLYIIVFAVGIVAVIALVAALARGGSSKVDADAAAAEVNESPSRAIGAGIVLFVVFAIIGSFAFAKTSSAEKSLDDISGTLRAKPLHEPNLKSPSNLKAPGGPSTTVYVNGQQFLWRYTYPGAKGDWNTYSYHDLVIPAGVTVMLDVTSSDVEHSWWVPELGGSIDAIPGYLNKGWIRADAPGIYDGASTTVSGTNYSTMTTSVIALPPELWERWVGGKQIEITEAMTALGEERLSGKEAELITGEKGAPAEPAPTEEGESGEDDQ